MLFRSQTLVGRDHLSRNLRRGRHRRDVHVEMATMQIDRDDGRPGMIDTEIHADTSFGLMGRQVNSQTDPGREIRGRFAFDSLQ